MKMTGAFFLATTLPKLPAFWSLEISTERGSVIRSSFGRQEGFG
jgi:hypothetical protein